MKTAGDAISIIQELPPEERQKVKDFLRIDGADINEDYSPEVINTILHTAQEADHGINMTKPMDARDAIELLRSKIKK